MPPKLYNSKEERRAADAERMRQRRAAAKAAATASTTTRAAQKIGAAMVVAVDDPEHPADGTPGSASNPILHMHAIDEELRRIMGDPTLLSMRLVAQWSKDCLATMNAGKPGQEGFEKARQVHEHIGHHAKVVHLANTQEAMRQALLEAVLPSIERYAGKLITVARQFINDPKQMAAFLDATKRDLASLAVELEVGMAAGGKRR